MTKTQLAMVISIASMIVGIAASSFYYDAQQLGISVFLLISLILLALFGVRQWSQLAINWRNTWLIVPILFFSAMVALRADGYLNSINLLLVVGLGGLLVACLRSSQMVDAMSLIEHATHEIYAVFSVGVIAPLTNLTDSIKWIGGQTQANEAQADKRRLVGGAVLRGVLLTIPILVVFGILLGSADSVFADGIQAILNLITIDLDELFNRLLLACFFAWFIAGILTTALVLPPLRHAPTPPADAPSDETPPRSVGFRIGAIESSILLGSVNAMFLIFVAIQFVYLFGGNGDLSYSEYARRGFSELVLLTVLVIGLVLLMQRITLRQTPTETTLFYGLLTVMIGLTGVILISAARRMGLYIEAFGYTRLRLWVSVFMPWLGLLLLILLADVYGVRKHLFSLGVLIVVMGHVGTLNLLNIDALIAERNLTRFYSNADALEVCYLTRLSADAVPALVSLYQRVDNAELKQEVGLHLYWEQQRLASYADSRNVTEYNRGLTLAVQALQPLTRQLEAHHEAWYNSTATFSPCDSSEVYYYDR
ncbi:MAG: DUF4153 domain-containing protein [Phototrophicaceae bacterium]